MDTSKMIARARATLLTPKTEWPIIAEEPETVGHLYSNYIIEMAAIPAVVQFLTYGLIGVRIPFGGYYRVGIVNALVSAVVTYALALIGVYIVALIVDALAPSFEGQRNRVQALKAVAYAYTATWVASILGIIPGIGIVAVLVGLIYAIYLLRLGLPATMKCPDSRAVAYTAVTLIVGIVVAIVLDYIGRRLFLGAGYGFGVPPPGYTGSFPH